MSSLLRWLLSLGPRPAGRVLPPDGCLGPDPDGIRTLRIYFVKPSQYDNDGYVLRYRWGVVPNNTLAVLAALNEAYARARPGIHIQTVLWEEMVGGVVSPTVMRSIGERGRRDGVEVIIALAGVQTGQYPRARDLALQFKRLDFPVLMGGFHVSSDEASRDFLVSAGITVGVGEAEATWAVLLDDYLRGDLQSSYSVTNGIQAKTGLGTISVPLIEDAPLPVIDRRYLRRFFNPTLSTIDTSRGCPFTCSYCAVKNVMGRTVRARDPGRVVDWVREAHDRHGVRSLFIVDDDLFRSPHWEEVLSGIAELRRSGRDVTFMMQTDVEAALYPAQRSGEESPRHCRSRRFVELAAEAGCYAVFIGFETFNPANLEQTRKVQNQGKRDWPHSAKQCKEATERLKARYKQAVDNWHRAGIAVHCGYMIGLPFDGRGCGTQAARDLKDIGVDLASFFPYTLLPGTEDYEHALADGGIVEHDFNCWDCSHVVGRHPSMTPVEVYKEYRDAHRTFYTWRRLAWCLTTYYGIRGLSPMARYGMLIQHVYYTYAYRRGWHPMMGGLWRIRDLSVQRQVKWNDEAAELYLGTRRPESDAPGLRAVAS